MTRAGSDEIEGWQACAALVERADPQRFRVAMAAPVAARARLFPLFAFSEELARAPWASQEPHICEMRLQWWRDALDEIAAGKPARAHEVAASLAQVIREGGLDTRDLDAMAAARRWDVYSEPFAGESEFEDYIDATAGGLAGQAARALDASVAAERAARNAGYAAGLARFFLAVPALEAAGRRPLVDPRPEAIAAQARHALSRLKKARAERPGAALPAFWIASGTKALLDQVVASPERVQAGNLQRGEAGQRFGLMWRAFSGRW